MITVLVTHQTAFRQEVVQNLYINKYGNGSSEPHVSVSFDINNDGESDFEFVSSLNKGIGEWYFNDYKSDPVKVR
ncbi:hypothetical protein [Paenibacillus taiwanensis]|uniref:hypothetical protein n=1 Tax=Paenibacillus taiwanensis TaxID=401638 RepID=UPI00048FE88D|nr:hypothetical protein [Paenibacillus taiwanensis]